ncbi:MAG: hypothetical protein HYR84_05505 [Planctomycetes bacterium]|nr:hypothetical protein [Planctomycetota bacterium]
MGAGARLPMVEHLVALFPNLRDRFRVTSSPDAEYNCIGWAAGVTDAWWWPISSGRATYWPSTVPRILSMEAFQAVFATLQYQPCESEELESGFEKVALFADVHGNPTHAARQLPNGRWTSKLGKAEDIEHDLHDLEGEIYGRVVLVMKRPSPS